MAIRSFALQIQSPLLWEEHAAEVEDLCKLAKIFEPFSYLYEMQQTALDYEVFESGSDMDSLIRQCEMRAGDAGIDELVTAVRHAEKLYRFHLPNRRWLVVAVIVVRGADYAFLVAELGEGVEQNPTDVWKFIAGQEAARQRTERIKDALALARVVGAANLLGAGAVVLLRRRWSRRA